MWLTTCAGSSFLHSSPSLQEDVGSLLMHLFEPAIDSWAFRSFELSTLLLAVIQQPFMEALWNFAGPSKEALEWRPCAPKVRGKYWIYIYFPNSLLCGRKEKFTRHIHIHGLTFALPVRVCDSVRHRICLLANFAAALLFRSDWNSLLYSFLPGRSSAEPLSGF